MSDEGVPFRTPELGGPRAHAIFFSPSLAFAAEGCVLKEKRRLPKEPH